MHWLTSVLLAIQVITSISIIVLVLLQQGKGADMGSAFGSGSAGSLFGSSGAANFLSRATRWAAIVFFASTIGLAYTSHHTSDSILDGGIMQGFTSDKPAPASPAQGSAVPAAPGSPAAGSAVPGAVPASESAQGANAVPSAPADQAGGEQQANPAQTSKAVPAAPAPAASQASGTGEAIRDTKQAAEGAGNAAHGTGDAARGADNAAGDASVPSVPSSGTTAADK